jgi:hypothetical protein
MNVQKKLRKALKARRLQQRKLEYLQCTYEPQPDEINLIDMVSKTVAHLDAEILILCGLLISQQPKPPTPSQPTTPSQPDTATITEII